MIDSPLIVKEWMDALYKNQSTWWKMIFWAMANNLGYFVAIISIWGIDWQEILLWTKYIKIQLLIGKKVRIYFLLATKNVSLSRYCFRSISSFSNLVLKVFRRTSRAKIALVFFFVKALDRKVWEGFSTWSSSSWHVQRWRKTNR